MRILQILHTDERGGIETLSSTIERGLAARGFQVETAYLFSRPGLGFVGKLSSAVRLAIRLLRDDHDAVIAYQATASVLTGLCGFLRRCPHRIVHQTAIPSETAWPIRFADRVAGTLGFYTTNIANTVSTRNEFSDYPGSYQRSMVVILHGLEPRTFSRDRTETRKRVGIPHEQKAILNVGRLTAQKNQRVLVDALARGDGWILVVVGQGDASALLDHAQSNGVADRLMLTGPLSLDDVYDLYGACDLFAFPSTWETFGLAAAEAAMAGIPMLVSDLAVLREVLASDPSPVTFLPMDDAVAWAAAIEAGLTAPYPAQQRAEFAETIRSRYSVKAMIDHYVELLTPNASSAGSAT